MTRWRVSAAAFALLVTETRQVLQGESCNSTEALYKVCDGFEEHFATCDTLPDCPPCEPVNCAFGEWQPWADVGACSGLRQRRREINVQSNECGAPCAGASEMTERFVKPECLGHGADCQLSDWSDWSSCKSQQDQSVRVREVAVPPAPGGKGCAGPLTETRACGGPAPEDCKLSEWLEWTSCSASCGEGRHSRMRTILQDARLGGKPCHTHLLETVNCTVQRCPGTDCELTDWSEWSLCDDGHQQQFRHRAVLKEPTGHGCLCDGALRQTQGCAIPPPADCQVGDWMAWSECDKPCGPGQRERERPVLAPAEFGGKCDNVVLREMDTCSNELCPEEEPPQDCVFEDWSPWSACSTSCGPGAHTRTRTIAIPAAIGGHGCEGPLDEARSCDQPSCEKLECKWATWSPWSDCTKSCGGGIQTRSRDLETHSVGGLPCKAQDMAEVQPCQTQPCGEVCVDGAWESWGDWSGCSGTCGSSYQIRSRMTKVVANHCGKAALGNGEEIRMCAGLPPCVDELDNDCELSPWSAWSDCNFECFGIRERKRYITQFPTGNGVVCDGDVLNVVEQCHPGSGEDPSHDCTEVPFQNCILEEWGGWSYCSVSCGKGQRTRKRSVLVPASGGGRPCDASLETTIPCEQPPCDSWHCQDCEWGPWSEWSECPRCGGDRFRERSVEVLPNGCGKVCDMKVSKEVSQCSNNCRTQIFCAWSEWSHADCDCSCGLEAAPRTRALVHRPVTPLTGYLFTMHDPSSKCSGSQLQHWECPQKDPCPPCVPRDCHFGEWSDWSEPTCDGLCTRHRETSVLNNECGQPCSGTVISTKRCPSTCSFPVDCEFADWTPWCCCTHPNQEKGQRFRDRLIKTQPVHGGKACLGPLHETQGCGSGVPEPCVFGSWNEWSACSVSCGTGWQLRSRVIVRAAANGGFLCLGPTRLLQPCQSDNAGCPQASDEYRDCEFSEWWDWSGCDSMSQRHRHRAVLAEASGGGKPCEGDVHEIQTCTEKVDCEMSEWTSWTSCDRSCGNGQQQRQRQIHQFPSNGGLPCADRLLETRGCLVTPCVYDDAEVSHWSEWSACSVSCGPGQQARTRRVLKDRERGGRGLDGKLREVKSCRLDPCPVLDCDWGDWEEWSACSATCGGGEAQRRRSLAVPPAAGGSACQAKSMLEMKACATGPCSNHSCVNGLWGDWSDWAACSVSCDGGTTTRTRSIKLEANDCGCPATGPDTDTAFCNVDISCNASKPCVFSEWSCWSDCSANCSGMSSRTREVQSYGEGMGHWCLGGLKEMVPCNPREGEEWPPGCGGEPVDCLFAEWSDWSPCSKTCGGGERRRSREISILPQYGGRNCEGPSIELQECARHSCGGVEPVDCKMGDWEEWGSCDKCDGERKRFRKIAVTPQGAGKKCDRTVLAEVVACPRRCEGIKLCEWSLWSEWTPCSASCGQGGKRSRRRDLLLSSSGRGRLKEEQEDLLHEAPSDPSSSSDEVVELKYEKPMLGGLLQDPAQRLQGSPQGTLWSLVTSFAAGAAAAVAAFGAIRFVWAATLPPRLRYQALEVASLELAEGEERP